jgi:hypothetical protein
MQMKCTTIQTIKLSIQKLHLQFVNYYWWVLLNLESVSNNLNIWFQIVIPFEESSLSNKWFDIERGCHA